MSQPLDFSNQDLRNRSFKGRKDLAGADFRNADIRGCDFSNANLNGADFSGVTSGQSGKQIFITGMMLLFFMVWAVVSYIFSIESVFSGKVAVRAENVILTIVSLVVAGVAGKMVEGVWNVANAAIFLFLCAQGLGIGAAIVFTEIAKGNTSVIIGHCLLLILNFFLMYYFLLLAIKNFRNITGTSFKEVELSNSKFMGAILKNCDFTDSNIYQTDWTHAYFKQCKFPLYLTDQKVRELCVSRNGTNEDFSFCSFFGLNLIGIDLCGAILTNVELRYANLTQADLQNVNLSKVQAIRTNFTKANFSGACLENWAITSETIFTDAICSHVYLDSAKTERKPASGSFEQGDFEKLVIQFTKTLDFLFRNGIDAQAFDFALNNLIEDYEEMGISLKGVDNLGDGDRLVRFNTVPDAPKAEMHAQFTEDYTAMHQQLEASRNKVWELQQKLDHIDLENLKERFELEKQLAIAIAKLEERPTSQYLQNLVYHQTNQRLLYAPHSTFSDTMPDKPNQINITSSTDVVLNTGDNNQGVIGKISGTVTNSIQQLRETNQPEAPQLSDLLEQLQKAVESSEELDKPEKEKALDYLNKIVEMSVKEPAQKKGMLPILLDAFTGVISKAANLIDPVKKIAAAILSIWQA